MTIAVSMASEKKSMILVALWAELNQEVIICIYPMVMVKGSANDKQHVGIKCDVIDTALKHRILC